MCQGCPCVRGVRVSGVSMYLSVKKIPVLRWACIHGSLRLGDKYPSWKVFFPQYGRGNIRFPCVTLPGHLQGRKKVCPTIDSAHLCRDKDKV